MATREDFCSFEALEGHCAPLSALSGVSTGDLAEAIASASDLIWALTGRQFGAYTETVRPDLRGEASSSFDLRRFPVSGITEAKIDGETLPASAYWVSDGHTLNRTDGTTWPLTQKLYLDDTEEETFSVTLTWGVAPPAAVAAATRRLACELLSLKFGGTSNLPDRVRSTVRQGISMEHVSAEDLLNNGKTGIFEIDLVLSTYNSDETAALPAVMSPDIGWYDHEGTTTVGAAPSAVGGVSESYVADAISAAVSGLGNDVVEVANFAALPGTGETGLIYVTLDTNLTYRWSGSAYVEISASLALGETSSTAYRGDRGKTAYDHSQVVSGNPHGTTAADVGADAEGAAQAVADGLPTFGSAAEADTGDFAPVSHGHTGDEVSIDSTGFVGPAVGVTNAQELGVAVDAIVASSGGGLQAVRAATTANITLSGGQTIDGVAVVDGDDVLVKSQSTTGDNGVYTVASGAWAAASWDGSDVTMIVREGTVNGGRIYTNSTNVAKYPATVASTNISGVIPTATLGSGTPSATNFLRGDQTWATPTSPPYDLPPSFSLSGKCITHPAISSGNSQPALGTALPYVAWLPAGTIDALGVAIQTQGAAGVVANLWIYTVDNYLRLGDLLINGGSVAADTTSLARYVNLITPTAVSSGWYGFVVVSTGTGTAPTYRGRTPIGVQQPILAWNSAPDMANGMPTMNAVTGLTNTPPAEWANKNNGSPASQTAGYSPHMIVRYQ